MFDNVLALQLLGPEASALMTMELRICMTAVGILVVSLAAPCWCIMANCYYVYGCAKIWGSAQVTVGSLSVGARTSAPSPGLLLNALALIRSQIIVSIAVTLIAFAGKFALATSLGAAGILAATSIPIVLIAVPASIWRWADHSARQQIMTQNE
jgi:hypothetical protein